MSEKPQFEPSEFRNQTDFLLNLIERAQFSYNEAWRLGGWPAEVVQCAYMADGDEGSEIFEATIARAIILANDKPDKEKELTGFVEWTWQVVRWTIEAGLGPRRTDKMARECWNDFIVTMTEGGYISHEKLDAIYGTNRKKETVLWVMKQAEDFLKEHDADDLRSFGMGIRAMDKTGEEIIWQGDM